MLSASLVERKVLTKEITMAKKVYSKPMLKSEAFVPQSYVAACGDTNKVYKFTCDATGGILGVVYQETNGQGGLQVNLFGGGDTRIASSYHACGITHEAPATDSFYDGYYVTGGDAISGGDLITPVKIWKGPDNNNVHCTTNLDMSSWLTAKS